ncbi:MAG: hypothetical protein OEZ68_11450 [Gammaproteobacteria bacterium]|nr:hypothetical protein [Gammaproteobacteria bacterium]MDH5801408.1 hypothetical protein [Gammaproteobacteria bacterium]
MRLLPSWLQITPFRVQNHFSVSRGISQAKLSNTLAYRMLQLKRFVENNLLQLLVLGAVIVGLMTISYLASEEEMIGTDAIEQAGRLSEQEAVYLDEIKAESSRVIEAGSQFDSGAIKDLVRKIENVSPGKLGVEHTALQLIQDDNWSNDLIISLAHGWITLSKSQQFIHKQTIWFQLLENSLTQKLLEEETASPSESQEEHRELLKSLALHLAIDLEAAANAYAQKKGAVNSNETSHLQRVSTTKTEEPATPRPTQTSASGETVKQSAQPQLARFDEEGFIDLSSVEESEVKPSVLNRIVRTKPVTVTEVENIIDTEALRKQQNQLTNTEARKITKQFVDYYQAGDIDKFVSLFSDNILSNDVNSIAALRKEYTALFKGTKTRKMIVHNVKWTFQDNKAEGRGSMVVNVRSGDAAKPNIFQGKIHLILEKNQERVTITRLFHEVK